MSMLSAQCDELRAMAESVGLAVPQAATLVMEAADTIWQLRDDLQRANAENDKLRNEVDNLLDFEHLTSVAVAYAGCDECGEYKQTMLRLFAENAKLRELVMDYEHCILHVDCDMCMYDGTTSEHCPLSPCFPDIDELHELGVVVDE